MFERPRAGERAVLVRLGIGASADPEDILEFEQLARSAGALPVANIGGRRDRPDPRFYVGSGKAAEIKHIAALENADVVLFDHPLSPSQERNLEKLIERRVLDRSGLILDIFAQRARSHEGKLEVELAQLKHIATRLVRGWTHLERQRGGGIGNRGPGETQLETDRRLIGKRVKTLTERLEKINQQRETGRQQRAEIPVPSLALVGYTNAGKSTLFRALTGANAYVADQLFATLDPTVRRIVLPGNTAVVIADTVGFIRELPHELVAAFQSTLTEARGATLLLHVVDVSDPRRDEHIDEVNRVLAEIGAAELPQILVFNKIDRIAGAARLDRDEGGRVSHVWLSAAQSQGLDLLREAVAERLARVARRATLRLPVSAGELRARLYAANLVLRERIAEDGAFEIDTELSEFELLKWAREPGVEILKLSGGETCTPAGAYLQSSPALRSSP
ncbi:MAG TPA: ribosome rescue GTPase HflX [Steroidobacteraceae bacterium]|jgi:GTP-binding protein HflX|nr:ribosome rescue GTPase HflX [Steroidobacteraceae bacterium]